MKTWLYKIARRLVPRKYRHLIYAVWAILWPPTQIDQQFFALTLMRNRILPRYRLDWPHIDWWSDERFQVFLEKFGEGDGYNASRKFALSQLLRLVDNVPGDTCECGVYRGASSYLICQHNQRYPQTIDRTHYLVDSYQGVSHPDENDHSQHWQYGMLSCDEETVLNQLSDFRNIKSLAGWIPDPFSKMDDKTFSFVHVDVDLHQPTRDCFAFFYERLNGGGILLCDDYQSSLCPGATKAADDFLADKPEKMIALPTGGGFFIKGISSF